MEKSNKKKITQVGSQKGSQNEPSGLIYWDDYNFENQSVSAGDLIVSFNLIMNATGRSSTD